MVGLASAGRKTSSQPAYRTHSGDAAVSGAISRTPKVGLDQASAFRLGAANRNSFSRPCGSRTENEFTAPRAFLVVRDSELVLLE